MNELVLGIETATPVCAVALTRNGNFLAEERYELPRLHGEIIVDLIDAMLRRCAVSTADLAAVAVSLGPGSFTGLRIGLSVAKGIAFADNLPIIGVHTPDAIAAGIVPLSDSLIITLPSRRGEVYAAPYRNLDGFYHRSGKIAAVEVEAFAQWAGGARYVAGPGYPALRQAGLDDFIYLKEKFWRVSAEAVARLGTHKLMMDETDDLDALEPAYVKAFHTTAKKLPFSRDAE